MEKSKDIRPASGPATMGIIHWLKSVLERDGALFLLIFTVLTLLACWPIILHPTRHLGSIPMADKGTNLWNLWWVYYALFERGISPLRCDMIFIPWGCDLRYHTLSITNGVLAAPVTAWFGSSVAYNLLFLIWTVLTGCFASMWARTLGAGRAIAILMGIVAAFGPYRWAHQIHLNLISTPWLFLTFYFCERSIESGRKRYVVAITLTWLMAFFSDWYYGLFVGFYLAIRSCVLLIQKRTLSSLIWIGACLVVPAAITGWVLWMYFHGSQALEGYVDPVSMTFSAFWSVDLLHLGLPLWLLPHFPDLQQSEEFWLHPGLLLMLLPLIFWRSAGRTQVGRRNRQILFAIAVGFLVFSLGPVLMCNAMPVRIFGLPVFLPAGIFELIPGLTVIRVYARFAYVGLAAYLLLGLLGLQSWIDRRGFRYGSRVVCVLLSVVFLVEMGWRFPRMVEYTPPPLIFPETPKPVLELPFTPSVYGGLHLYHQTLHKQPIFVAEFSRLGYYREKYLESFPILEVLDRMAQGEIPKGIGTFDQEKFCLELQRLGPVHMILSSAEKDPEKAERIRRSVQDWIKSCGKEGIDF